MNTACKTSHRVPTRRGAIIPLVALLIPVFIVFIAFAVDFAKISVARQHLQNASDAGANAAMTAYNNDPELADLTAYEAVNANNLFGMPIEIADIQQVEYGTWDAETETFSVMARSNGLAGPRDLSGRSVPTGADAVRIRLIRSENTGNGVSLFFARMFGTEFATVTAETVASGVPTRSGFIGIDSVRASGSTFTDSYNSEEGNYGTASLNENGNILSRGVVSFSGLSDIRGDVQTSGIRRSGFFNSTGGVLGPLRRDFEPVPAIPATVPNNNDSISSRAFRAATRDLRASGFTTVTLNSGVYHFRNIRLSGLTRLNLVGDVTIFADSFSGSGATRINIDGQAVFNIANGLTFSGASSNRSQRPINMQFNVRNGPVRFSGRSNFFGVIYAPGADISLSGGAEYFGGAIGRTLSMSGRGRYHYDESLDGENNDGGRVSIVF